MSRISERSGDIIYTLNEIKKTMLLIVDDMDEPILAAKLKIPLVQLHNILAHYIEKADKEGYLYKLKR